MFALNKMEPEPWEALDLELDDSPLVPCKRKISHSPTKINNFKTNDPFLGPCSRKSQSQSNSTRLIPGPAGAVQSAMHRKLLMSVELDEEPIPTQEYIRRAVEAPGIEDEDFSRDPWLFAVDFVRRRQGSVASDGVAIGTPLIEIKNGIINTDNKVPQIVAILKSTTPNGLGDMMATLKDPTGTIDASIHRRVLTEKEFGKGISVGAVLILQKVAVFSPCRSARYLNITLSNLVQVISKDTETSLKQNYPAMTVKHSAPDIESSEKSRMPPKTSSLSQGRVEGIMNYLKQNANIRGTVQNTKEMEKVSSFRGFGGSNSQNSFVQKEPLTIRQDVYEAMEVVIGTATNDNVHANLLEAQHNLSNQAARTEGIMNHLRQNANVRGIVQNAKQMEKVNLAPSISCSDGGSRSQNSSVEKEPLVVRQDDVHIMKEVAVGRGTTGNDEVILSGEKSKPTYHAVTGNLLEETICSRAAANIIQVPTNEENENINGVENRRKLLISKGSLTQWTNEQLDELLAFD